MKYAVLELNEFNNTPRHMYVFASFEEANAHVAKEGGYIVKLTELVEKKTNKGGKK